MWNPSEKGETAEEEWLCLPQSLGWLQRNAATNSKLLLGLMVPSLYKASRDDFLRNPIARGNPSAAKSREVSAHLSALAKSGWLGHEGPSTELGQKNRLCIPCSPGGTQGQGEVTCGKTPFTGTSASSLTPGPNCGLSSAFPLPGPQTGLQTIELQELSGIM